MTKHFFGFYNEDEECEVELLLDESQQALLQTLQGWGYISDNITIQDHGAEVKYPPYHNCPECGKTLILLNGIDNEAEYWCDNCGLDVVIEVSFDQEEEDYGDE